MPIKEIATDSAPVERGFVRARRRSGDADFLSADAHRQARPNCARSSPQGQRVDKPYGKTLWRSLPPMKRTREIADVQAFFGVRSQETEDR